MNCEWLRMVEAIKPIDIGDLASFFNASCDDTNDVLWSYYSDTVEISKLESLAMYACMHQQLNVLDEKLHT